ncbi:ATP-grasp domain-containing protein [Sanguibacter antarcticus]|uniref:ATP-grasp domain-containing protein n=1 Tax=Sanguibacter antarcticus TaxID=372484 RepID=A0A2A9E4L1_9MICO|nr:ATP-grasp domain-containing protein [Sanguibacter antarcticus]PFG33172.1 ATP-grasp domain-containing protein [Sanguibacter antarcticus]
MTLNIWLNRTYATNYWFLQMLRNNPDHADVRLFATHTDETSPVLRAADVALMEPSLGGEDYVDWALEFCRTHAIDVLLPGRGIRRIVARSEEFEAIGVKVLASPSASIALLDDKDAAYRSARGLGIPVPPWRTAQGADELEEAYSSLRDELEPDEKICIKPISGVGAEGYRLLDDRPMSVSDLLAAPAHRARLDEVTAAFRAAEAAEREVPRLMVMPYMASPEISVDCLSTTFGETLVALPRAKAGRRRTFLADTPEAARIAHRVVDSYQLAYLTNTQLRWWRGELTLLEVNTRPSGGLYASSLTGVNLPWAAIQLALTGQTTLEVPELGASFVTVETLVPLPRETAAPALLRNVNPGLVKEPSVDDLEASARKLADLLP